MVTDDRAKDYSNIVFFNTELLIELGGFGPRTTSATTLVAACYGYGGMQHASRGRVQNVRPGGRSQPFRVERDPCVPPKN